MSETNAPFDPVVKLGEKLGCQWETIAKAKSSAEDARQELDQLINSPGDKLLSDECSVVLFGSVARGETTSGSDIDWILLIDGPADPQHRTISQVIGSRIQESFKSPNATEAFGGMAFSHDLIGQIGGEGDTNSNITKRILLLSESCAVGPLEAYDRVLRSVLKRYLEDDVSRTKGSGKKNFHIPRFLLNDIVRYWRTMAVDYVHKRRTRADSGWATRNVKLRFSRKLIFVSGLLTCFSCHLNPRTEIGKDLFGPDEVQLLTDHLAQYAKMRPLEVLAEALFEYASEETAKNAMDAYDSFLQCIDDEDKWGRLDELEPESADDDPLFQEIRKQSHKFQASLTKLFFDDHEGLRTLTRTFGVF